MEAPDQYFQGGFCGAHLTPDTSYPSTTLESKEQHFAVEDLLDFSKDDMCMAGDDVTSGFDSAAAGSSIDSSTVAAVDSCNSASFSGSGPGPGLAAATMAGGPGEDVGCRAGFGENDHFSSELCVPYDDLAELEWLSNFVEESFSSEDLQKLQLISGIKDRPDEGSESTRTFQAEPTRTTHHQGTNISNPIFSPNVISVPAKARSKRSRAAPCDWSSRLLILNQPNESSSHVEPGRPTPTRLRVAGKKNSRSGLKKKPVGPEGDIAGEGRKCLHCATDRTPQWRTGPMGPKTLCNACGVRYKSGRLVPEYRPAASPTFVLTRHSNSHRKVLELRRQKEQLRAQQLQQQQFTLQDPNMALDIPSDQDYLIHQQVGPDFRQMI